MICIVDTERFNPLLTEDLRFGLRVTVFLVPSVPMMCTEQALKTVGPACFGYKDVNYKSMGGFKERRSEIHEPSI